ncbi:MAG: hypothetical protein JRN71_07690 [Nitrososphaerota archaeon]|nr:hypothetical protein [Nitrososphaerota archaeon]
MSRPAFLRACELIPADSSRGTLKPPIASIEVSYLVHATEDEGKVEAAVARFLGGIPDFERDSLEGHFGNQIVRARAHLTGDAAASAFRHLVAAIPPQARKAIVSELGSYVDEHSALYIRLDKQRLVSGSPEIGKVDAVRVKVKPRLYALRGGAMRFYTEELEAA